MSKKPLPLPDLDDDATFRARLSPLVASVIPTSHLSGLPPNQSSLEHRIINAGAVRSDSHTDNRKPANTHKSDSIGFDLQTTEYPETQSAGGPDFHNFGDTIHAIASARRQARSSAAEALSRVEALRGMKRRFEYLIPERVGRALAEDAAVQGKSATTRLLEVLRDAGYPVIPEDLVDMRKMPKR